MRFFLTLLLCLAGGQSVFAAPVVLEADFERVHVSKFLKVAIDTNANLGLKEALSGDLNFEPSQKDIPSWGFRSYAVWAYLDISTMDFAGKSMLEIDMPLLDKVDFWLLQGDSLISEVNTGYSYPFKNRPIKHRNFVFEIPPSVNKDYRVFIRIKSIDRLELPVILWEETAFYQADQKEQFFSWVFMGLVLGSIFLLALMFIAFRDKAYLYYAFFMSFFIIFIAGQMGYVHEYLWPDFLAGLNHYMHLCILCMLLFQVLLITKFLDSKNEIPKLHVVLKILLFYLFALFALTFVLPLNVSLILAVASVILVMGTIFMVSLYASSRSKAAWLFMLGWGVTIVVGILYSLKSFGAVPYDWAPTQLLSGPWLLQIIILSLSLGERLTQTRLKKEEWQREAIENLKRANIKKDEFLATTSHELRTPLNGMIGLSESLLDGAAGNISQEKSEKLTMIVASCRRLANLVNDILDLSQYNNKELDIKQNAVDISQIITMMVDIHRPLSEQKNNEIKLIFNKSLPFVLGDEDRIQQILSNILSNAIRYTDNGIITVSAYTEDVWIKVCVQDTGVGIEAKNLSSLLSEDIDIDNSQRHSFMGLNLCKKIVELHGGEISVDSEINRGSEFCFTLPIAQFERDSKEINVPTVTKLQHSESFLAIDSISFANEKQNSHILVVDDELVNIKSLKEQLIKYDFRVSSVRSGAQALAFLDKYPVPDLILLDVMMPGMSGFEVCKKIREKWDLSVLPVIMLTTNNQVTDLVAGLDSGANDYLTKPFNNYELLARVNTHLGLTRTNNNYARFVPQQFIQRLNKNTILDVQLGDYVKQNMSVFFLSVKNYDKLSQAMNIEENFNFLNSYLQRITPCIEDYCGVIDK